MNVKKKKLVLIKKIRRVPSYGKYVATLLFIMHGLLDVSRFKRFLTLFLVILVHVLQFLDETLTPPAIA